MLRMTRFSLTVLLSTNGDGGCGVQRARGSVRPCPPWIYCDTLEVTQVQPRSIVVTGSPWGGCLESESFRLEKTFKIIKPNHQPDRWLWLCEGRGRRGCRGPAGRSPFEGLRPRSGNPIRTCLMFHQGWAKCGPLQWALGQQTGCLRGSGAICSPCVGAPCLGAPGWL